MTLKLISSGATKRWSGKAEERFQVTPNLGDVFIAHEDSAIIYGCIGSGIWEPQEDLTDLLLLISGLQGLV